MTRKKIDVFGLVLTSLVAIVATVILILDFAWSTFFGVLFVYVLVFLSWFLVRRSKPVDRRSDVLFGGVQRTSVWAAPRGLYMKLVAVLFGIWDFRSLSLGRLC